jgi:fluoride ion exporter CrcB/FEX
MQTFDTIFWLLFALGVFMFPMGLLAVNVLDSFAGLNPVLIIAAALNTLLPYSCIVAIFFCIGFLLTMIAPFLRDAKELFSISIAGIYYLLLVAGHLLGRFYFKYQEKLSWDG